MQILLNHSETNQAVEEYIRDRLSLSDDISVIVEVSDDATATVLINEEPSEDPSPAGGPSTNEPRQKRSRRTKAQIEADNKAEEERRLAAQAEASGKNETTSATPESKDSTAEAAQPSEPVTQEAVEEPEPEVVQEDPSEPAEPAVAVEEEPEPEVVEEEPVKAETPAAAEGDAPKPAISLFANLRRPNNG